MANVITCTQCGKYDQMAAAYNCTNCDNTRSLDPRPEGIPHSQPCPGCGFEVQASNIRCLRCAVS